MNPVSSNPLNDVLNYTQFEYPIRSAIHGIVPDLSLGHWKVWL